MLLPSKEQAIEHHIYYGVLWHKLNNNMKTTITFCFETKANVTKTSFCAYTIKFFSYSDAKEFHKLVCKSNTFRNCFSHIDGVTINIETDVNVSIFSNSDTLTISVVND